MDIPRANRMDRWTAAERAIHEAVQIVESLGADTRLTEAVVLLGRAQAKVAEFVDDTPAYVVREGASPP